MRTTASVEDPRLRELSSSSVNVETWAGNNCFRPLTMRLRSVSCPFQPYSLCMSNINDDAWRCCKMPTSSNRVRNVLPVPLLPNTPMERLTSSSRLRQSLCSMSSGLPIQKCFWSSWPKTNSTSRCEAKYVGAKWGGMVLAADGAWSSSPRTVGSTRLGSTEMVP